MKNPLVSVHSSQPGTSKKRCYIIQLHLHGIPQPSFRLAVLSDKEHEELKGAMRRMQIGSAPRLKEFYILPQPSVFLDVDKLIEDIVDARDEAGNGC